MLMENQVKFRSLQHFWSFTAKPQKSLKQLKCVGTCSNTFKKKTHTSEYSLSVVVQVPGSTEIQNRFEKMLFALVLS